MPPDFRFHAKEKLNAWSLIVAVDDDQVLKQTLLRSPAIDARCEILLKRGYKSAGKAYNAGISDASNEILVFAHQDVYLPADWPDKLSRALTRLGSLDFRWSVLGVYGLTRAGRAKGHVYSTGLAKELGEPFDEIVPAQSLDEMLLVLRRSSGLIFDDRLPGFHLYGTDICMEARRRSMKAYLIPAFCLHNSKGLKCLPMAFWRSYFYLRRKWWEMLPINTCCVTITKVYWPVARYVLKDVGRNFLMSRAVGARCQDPELLYQTLVHRRQVKKRDDPGPPNQSALE